MLSKYNVSAISAAVIAALSTMTPSAHAQTAQLERIEITGSSIKRIASEGALPVQIVTAEQIRASGATSVSDVIQRLPSMQGFSIADTAIGSNSGGIATASIHDIGESYTLVLLNGRRIAPTGSGSTINLNSIPMSAIERIEVLTDGASALYGSDAIAGVVNFVLKRNAQGGTLNARVDVPLEGGGESANASITYGFGDLDKDRFTLMATYQRDQQKQMKSGDRNFAKSAYLPFEYAGRQYIYDRTSTSADPANAQATFKPASGLPSYSFNPYYKTNGNKCAPNNVYSLNNAVTSTSIAEMCAFDFVSTIDIYPESTRDSLYLTGQVKATNNITLFSDFAYTRLDLMARIAPNPVPVAIPVSSALFGKYVAPYLTATQLANLNTNAAGERFATALYRATDFGTRDSQTITDAKHLVVGADAEFGDWSFTTAATYSQNSIDEKYEGGYFKTKEFTDMVKANAFDPFIPSGGQSAAVLTQMSNSIFHGTIRTADTTLKGVDFRASTANLFKLPAGEVALGVGADFRNYTYKQTPDARAVAGEIYNYAPVAAYDLSRDNMGVFAEFAVPVIKNLDLTAAVRYDSVGDIKDALNNKNVGRKENASTYKVSARYQVSPSVLLRGSYGTGFKAPSMLSIAQPVVPNGVTAGSYDCPEFLRTANAAACMPGGKAQYNQLSGGNEGMKPEKSTNGTFGIRLEPNASFGIGADFWQVELSDVVSAVTANQAFADAAKYADLFTLYKTPAQPQLYWTFKSMSTNIAKAVNRGIDWDIVGRVNTDIGRLTLGLTGTYMIRASYTRSGTDNVFVDSMGKYGENAAVTFRNVIVATAKLDTGAFSNSLILRARSGYKDITATARDVATNRNVLVSVDVPRYATVNWQGTYKHSKAMEFRAGINNLFNEAPPFTLRDSSGHQVGYDPRYADPKMRTAYLMGSYNF